MRSMVMAAGLLCLLVLPAAAESEANKVERLEREVDELKREIQEMKRALPSAPAAQPAPRAPAPSAAAPGAAAPPVAATTASGVVEEAARRVTIGGYGSVRFESNSADDTHDTFTFRRFVLTADAAVAPKMRFYLELEFERFRELELERGVTVADGGIQVKQGIEGTAQSEISLEQVYFEWALSNLAKLQIGGVLVPVGRFNINHDDNRWDLPRRSLVDRGSPVLPVKSAWDELGVGFVGETELGEQAAVNYRLYVVNGAILEPTVENVVQSRNPDTQKLELESEFETQTGTFGNDVKDSKAVTGRLAFSPALGHEIGGSFYYGRYTPDFLPNEAIKAFAVDGLSIWGPLEVEGEFILADYGDVDRVARGFAQRTRSKEAALENDTLEAEIDFELGGLAEQRRGYWIEPRWRFRPEWLRRMFGGVFEDPVLTAVARWEQVWIDGSISAIDFTGGEINSIEKHDRRVDRFSIGGSYRPVPLVAFQLAYEYTKAHDGTLSDVTNFIASGDDSAHAVLLGAAFGF